MDVETVQVKMMAQVNEARQRKMAEVFAWVFEVDGFIAYTTLQPRGRAEPKYLLRVSFDDFPRRAPSYLFVDRETRQVTDAAWPPNVRHGSNGICTPGTREFHETLHCNDAQWPWDPDRFSFLDTLQRIHQMMERGLGG